MRAGRLAGWIGLAAAVFTAGCDAPPADGKIEIRYMAWGTPQQLALEKQFCEEFSRKQGRVRVKFIQVPSSAYLNKMILMLASRTAPDVMRVDHYNFPSLVAKDYFYRLDDLVAADKSYRKTDYFPVTIEEGLYQGDLYGLNVLFGAPVIYYNKDLLRAAGLEEPYALWKRGEWTWDTYLRYAKAMTTKDAKGKPRTFGATVTAFPFQCAVIYAFGGEIMKDGRVCLAEGKAAEAMRFLYELRFVHKAEPNASQAANSLFSFDGGKIGMNIDWMGVTPRLREVAKFDWDVCPLPMKPGGTAMVKGNQLVMSAESKHPKEAWEFMKFMTGRETEEKLYVQMRRCFPTRKDVAYSPEYLRSGDQPPHHLDAFVYEVEHGRTLPITSRWSEWNTEFSSGIEPLFNGTTADVDGTLREAERRANATLAVQEGL